MCCEFRRRLLRGLLWLLTQNSSLVQILGEIMEDIKRIKTVVFFSIDALGHINPILSIIKELQLRKYNVILLTTRPLKESESLKQKGIILECCVGTEVELDKKREKGEVASIVKNLMEIFKKGPEYSSRATYSHDGAVGKYLDDVIQTHDAIEDKLKSLKPDLIVVDHVVGVPCTTTVARRWVRFYSGFPTTLVGSYNDNFVATLGLKLEEMNSIKKNQVMENKKEVLARIRSFFAEKGLSDEKLCSSDLELAPTSPYLNFYMGPKELGFENESTLNPLPDIWFRLEHTIAGEEEKAMAKQKFTLPDNLCHIPGKLIYFSLGTLVSGDADVINRLLMMLSKSPNKIIVSMGKKHEQIKLYSNMWGEEFVDQKAVLPHVDLFITHGGHNSIVEAFYYGVPGLIVMPIFADQFDSAQRVEDCCFGVRLNPFECKEEELLNAIDSLLANKDLKKRMADISFRLGAIRYHELAADKLEKLLED